MKLMTIDDKRPAGVMQFVASQWMEKNGKQMTINGGFENAIKIVFIIIYW